MTTHAATVAGQGTVVARLREAEQTAWRRYGLEARERFVTLRSGARLRVIEVGSGRPLLLVHGTAGLGAWPPLVNDLRGFRCLILERPGWGLSDQVDWSARDYGEHVTAIQQEVLDDLGVTRADVVGASIGGNWALRLAAAAPSRVDRVVLLGTAPVRPDLAPPKFIKLLRTPIGAIIARLPETRATALAQLRANGHGFAIKAGRVPDDFIGWRIALRRAGPSMVREREMVRAILGPNGWRNGLMFSDAELAQVRQPILMVVGSHEPNGGIEYARRVASGLGRVELVISEHSGHVVWLDDAAVGSRVAAFLRATS